jgi:hypothetical protein
MSTRPSIVLRESLALAVALGLLVAHVAWFGAWLVDDAGISFAYSRTLASGQGFTAQPGTPPVEGFSNPLWTLLAAALYAVGAFPLPLAAKLLSLLFTVIAFGVIWRSLRTRTQSAIALGAPLVMLAVNTGFVIWTTSGLENPLLACLAVSLCAITIRRVESDTDDVRPDAWAGVLAALLALTRPDALLYAFVHPLASAVALTARGCSAGRIVKSWLATAAGFIPILGGYFAFRVGYFGAWAPNTYYAKSKPSLANLTDVGKLLDLIEGGVGDFLWPALALGAAAFLLLAVRRRLSPFTLVLFAYLGVAAAIYVVMPRDWMGEFRFATPFFPFLYWALAALALDTASAFQPGVGARRLASAVAIVGVAQFALIGAARSAVFRDTPTLPLSVVQEFGARGFNRLATVLPPGPKSVLTPDLGGVLLDSTLRVYDLAGLCDREIARALAAPDGLPRLHAYVFEQIRPTFIHTHGPFTRAARLHEDPRFARDYVTIHETVAAPPQWAAMWRGLGPPPAFSGDYVRRDALGGDGALAELQRAYDEENMELFVTGRSEPPRLSAGWPQVRWAIRRLTAPPTN